MVAFQLKRGYHTSSTINVRVTFCAKRDSRIVPQNASLHSSAFLTQHTNLHSSAFQINARACELHIPSSERGSHRARAYISTVTDSYELNHLHPHFLSLNEGLIPINKEI